MIPFYFYYSMFGFQRIGDLIWLAADIKAKGFLLGATAGRTTLNGEGLQHQDGHSHLLASTIPTLLTYDPAFAYEVAAIVADGLRRMYAEGEEFFYYLTLYNENYHDAGRCPKAPKKAFSKACIISKPATRRQKIQGAYFRQRPDHPRSPARATNSRGTITAFPPMCGARRTTSCCAATRCEPSAGTCCIRRRRQNILSGINLQKEEGVFVAVSDYMNIVPDQIAPWVPGGLTTLGTDGFGRSDTRANLRRFFEVDAELSAVATLYALHQKEAFPASVVEEAIKKLGVDPEKPFPFYL